MQIFKNDVLKAVQEKILTSDQAEKLWRFWQAQQKDTPSFKFTHILYYLGGFIAISAVTIYVTTAWEALTGYPLLILSSLFFIFGFAFLHYFLQKRLLIPAGIMAAFSLAMVPLIVYNIQAILGMTPSKNYDYSDFHYWIDWYWINMELATLLVGIVMFYFYRFPFLLFPISVIIWYMSMDSWPLLFNMQDYTYNDRAMFTMVFGLIMLLIAIYVDLRNEEARPDYAFWLYIFGVLTFWGGLSSLESGSELGKFFYCLINVALLMIGAVLNRRVFAVFGAIGILMYLGHLAFTVFAHSLSFPIAMVFIGVFIILTAVFFTKIEGRLNAFMLPYTPQKIRNRMRE